jgi:hypothetical protein
MHKLMGIFVLVTVLCLPALTRGETVSVIDDFAVRKDSPDWSAADKGEVRLEKGVLRIDYPKYQPGDAAAWPRATRNVESIDFTKFNGIRVDIENPTQEVQFLQLGFRDANGSQGQLGFRFAPGQKQVLSVRFDEARPSGPVDWSGVQLLDFMRTQPATPMTWHVRRIELFADQPARTVSSELNELHRKTAEVLQQAKASKLVSGALETQATQTLKQWSQLLKQPRGIFAQAEKCRIELTAIHGQVRALVLARELQLPMIAWSVPVGTVFRPNEALLQFDQPAKEIAIYSAKGQYEESIVRLTNLTDSTQDLRLRCLSENPELVRALSIRRNQPVRASDKSIIGDALVPLDDAGVVTIPSYQTVELWLRLDAKHHTLPSGSYKAELDFVDLRRGTTTATRLPLAITIRNFDLATIQQAMKVQGWAELFAGRSFVVRNNLKVARDNLIDYGINVVNMGPDEIPWPKLNPTGELTEPLDYSRHDETLALLRGKDNPFILYFMNMDDNNAANWRLRAELAPGSEAWNRAFKAWLIDWTKHLQSLGLTTKDYALYLTDEPGPEELDRYRIFGKVVREVDPSIQIYINGAELYDDPASTKELMSVTDIWQPDETVGFVADPKLLPTLKNFTGKQLWVYACRTGMRSRGNNAHDYYRLMAWRAMRDGLTGIGYWSYCAAASDKEDLWDGTREPASGAVLVYPSEHGVLSSVRWELIRQSVDDTKYVQLLKQAGERTSAGSLKSKLEALYGTRLTEVVDHRDDPASVTRWRIDAGQAIEESSSNRK